MEKAGERRERREKTGKSCKNLAKAGEKLDEAGRRLDESCRELKKAGESNVVLVLQWDPKLTPSRDRL